MTETLAGSDLSVGTDPLRSEPADVTGAPNGVGAAEVRSAEDSTTDAPAVSIVVPYYNPGDRLRPTIEHLVRVLDGSGMSFEVIPVSDGSTDGSPLTLSDFPESVVRRIAYASNVGKGHALRIGLASSRGRYVGFIDADGDISPEFLASFLSVFEEEDPHIVVGSKRHPESSVRWTPLRRAYSWGHQTLIRRLFRLDVKDTQVGIKLMDRQVVLDVLPLLREDRFALDLEFLVLARRLGYTRIVEAPVRIEQRVNSTISLKRAWRLLLDTFRIFVRLSVRREYRTEITTRSGVDAPAAAESLVTLPRTAPAPTALSA